MLQYGSQATGAESMKHSFQIDLLTGQFKSCIAYLTTIISPVHYPTFQALQVNKALKSHNNWFHLVPNTPQGLACDIFRCLQI